MSHTHPDDAVRLGAAVSATLDVQALQARYLRALAALTPHHAHELRGRLGTAALHLDLAGELLGRDPAATAASQPADKRAIGELSRAREGLRDMSDGLESMLGLTRVSGAPAQAFDARDVVREVERAVGPAARARRIEQRVSVPGTAVNAGIDRDVLRQALVVIAVALLEAIEPGGAIELALAATADQATITLAGHGPAGAPAAVSGPDTPGPVGIVRAALESNGCTARADANRLIMSLPLTSRSDP